MSGLLLFVVAVVVVLVDAASLLVLRTAKSPVCRCYAEHMVRGHGRRTDRPSGGPFNETCD